MIMTSAARTLLLMPCSDTKLDHADQPRRLYLGPLWQTLRTHRGELPWQNVFVLSGKFGFISAGCFIQTYNARLSTAAADRLIARGIRAPNDHHGEIVHGGPCAIDTIRPQAHRGRPPFGRVISAGAGDYARVFAAFVAELQAAGVITPAAELRQVAGGIGTQRGQLGHWLREISCKQQRLAA